MVAMQALVLASLAAGGVYATQVSPIGKALELLSDLEVKIIGEGEKAQALYEEFSEWCEDRSRQLGFEIKTGKSEVAELTAVIEKATDDIQALQVKIEEVASHIATDESDLAAAKKVRATEAADFAAEEKELMDTISSLRRAIAILTREMQKTGASMLQFRNARNLVQAFDVMVQASLFSSADAAKLTALVQTNDEDADLGAPDAATYKGHSGNIIETLENLLEKAQSQLEDSRKKETTALHNFEMLKQSLEDSVKFATADMEEAKKILAATTEKKSVADGDFAVTTKELKADTTAMSDLHHDCMATAENFETETKSRAEELKALAAAKKVIKESTGGAEALTYSLNQLSFLQITSGNSLSSFQVVRFVRDLARKHTSTMLAQLASQMASAVRFSDDPFAKVKGLISDMIGRLEDDEADDASHKAYCDKELAETNEKKADKTTVIEKVSTSIDQKSASSTKLKEEVAVLQKELAELAASQAQMDKLRQEEHDLFLKNKADMEAGLAGIKLALKVLREYYGTEGKSHEAAEGSSSGIVALLEVVESDFSKGLAGMVSDEETAQTTYESETKENEIEKATKDKDVEYKTKEAISLDKAVAEAQADLSDYQKELDAVMEYLKKLEEECVAKPDTYAERKARREAEIAGLKEALSILDSETALLQQGSRRALRSARRHF